jgi:L-asparaginase II
MSVPDLTSSKPLFGLSRGGVLEVVVYGLSFWKRQGQPLEAEEASVRIATRSLLKPWQFLAAGASGPEPFWALGFSSHSGQPEQMSALRQLCRHVGVKEDELRCPASWPLDTRVAARMELEDEPRTRLHHPCSGKHLVMLAACRRFGFPSGSYAEPGHPIHERLAARIAAASGCAPDWVRDGCGLPTAVLPVSAHVALWESLALDESAETRELERLWTENPRLVGGLGRLDTELTEASGGAIVAKQGADGLLVLQSLPTGREPVATCFLKLSAGDNGAHQGLALWATLRSVEELNRPFERVLAWLEGRVPAWKGDGHEIVLMPPPGIVPERERTHVEGQR